MLSVLAPQLCLATLAAAATSLVQIPKSAPPGSPVLDEAPVAFSFEFPEFPNYIVNVTNTLPCLANFQELTGVWPRIRLGGTTEDQSLYNHNLTVPVLKLNATSYQYGPAYLNLAAKYKGNVVLGLNRGGNKLANTIDAAKAAVSTMKNLYAIELGNEPDIFPYLAFPIAANASTWIPTDEAQSEDKWQKAIGSALHKKKIIQAGNFVLPPSYGSDAVTLFSLESAEALQYVKLFSHHNYPQTVAPGASGIPGPNLTLLMSHVNTAANVALYGPDTEVTRARGMQYVFGETNSVSGGGSKAISKTFGAALWVLDYALRSASAHIARNYFHHGNYLDSFYVWWTPLGVTSPYYGGYAAAMAMAGGGYIEALDEGMSSYAAYVVFTRAKTAKRVVLINTEYYDGVGGRSNHTFKVEGLPCGSVGLTWLRAPSALSRQDEGVSPTLGGQIFADDGCGLSGPLEKETVKVSRGHVEIAVAASEAVVIDL